MLDCLLSTLIRELQNDSIEGRKQEAKRVSCRFVRSVARIFVIFNAEMTPQSGKKRLWVTKMTPSKIKLFKMKLHLKSECQQFCVIVLIDFLIDEVLTFVISARTLKEREHLSTSHEVQKGISSAH